MSAKLGPAGQAERDSFRNVEWQRASQKALRSTLLPGVQSHLDVRAWSRGDRCFCGVRAPAKPEKVAPCSSSTGAINTANSQSTRRHPLRVGDILLTKADVEQRRAPPDAPELGQIWPTKIGPAPATMCESPRPDGLNSGKLGQDLLGSDQSWSGNDHNWPKVDRIGPDVDQLGRNWTRIGQICPVVDQIWPTSAKLGAPRVADLT